MNRSCRLWGMSFALAGLSLGLAVAVAPALGQSDSAKSTTTKPSSSTTKPSQPASKPTTKAAPTAPAQDDSPEATGAPMDG